MDLYGDQLRKPHTSVVECEFDGYFDQQMRELETIVDERARPESIVHSELSKYSSSSEGSIDEGPPPPVPGLLTGMDSSSQFLKAL